MTYCINNLGQQKRLGIEFAIQTLVDTIPLPSGISGDFITEGHIMESPLASPLITEGARCQTAIAR